MTNIADSYPEFNENQAVYDGLVKYVMERDGTSHDETVTNINNLLGSDEVAAQHTEKMANSAEAKLVQAQELVRRMSELFGG